MASNGSASQPEGGGEPAPSADWASELDIADAGLVTRVLRLNLLVGRLLERTTISAGIAPADYLVLGVVRQSPHHRSSPTRICALLGRSTGGMTLTIDRLEAAGWLTRSPDPDDRRRVIVTLSPAGLTISTQINKALHGWEDGLNLDSSRRAKAIEMADELLGLFEAGRSQEATTVGSSTQVSLLPPP
jgi:DNA-binding MarR family transcriptional regulator